MSNERTIYKYILEIADQQIIQVPTGAELLTVQTQNEKPCLWALVDPEAPKVAVVIETIGTGNPADDAFRKYIGTYQIRNGSFVFHVFERDS